MLEKLPLDFVRKIFNLLTTGNDDVNFYCMCLQNQNREAATNSPIKFGLNLLKINLLCRLPFSKNKIFSQKIGEDYLSEIFVRPAVCEIASGMLDNAHIITDIFSSAFTLVKSKEEIYEEIERETGVRGFAKLRNKYNDKFTPIKYIYKKINSQLRSSVDYKIELSKITQYYFPNKYITRLLDIAKCNGMKTTAIVNTCYSSGFIKGLLKKCEIAPDELLISCEDELYIKNYKVENPHYTCILSSNYNEFIKDFTKHGCKPLYYRNPQTLMERVECPELDPKFRQIYNTISGMRLFNGLKRMSREYELSYLCIAPAVFGFAQRVAMKALNNENVICLCDKHSVFGSVIRQLTKDSENISFFPWSALASNKYKSVAVWREIVEETPIFDNAQLGIFDLLLRYPISDKKQSDQTLAQIMATAWLDKTSGGVNSAIAKLVKNKSRVVIADPIAGCCSSCEFCSILEEISESTIYTCVTMSSYLGGHKKELKPLARLMQGNKPLLYQIDGEQRKWIYQKKLNVSRLKEIYKAVSDFCSDFSWYFGSGTDYLIKGEDALSLYKQALPQLEKME